jgi:hypothetical protein
MKIPAIGSRESSRRRLLTGVGASNKHAAKQHRFNANDEEFNDALTRPGGEMDFENGIGSRRQCRPSRFLAGFRRWNAVGILVGVHRSALCHRDRGWLRSV